MKLKLDSSIGGAIDEEGFTWTKYPSHTESGLRELTWRRDRYQFLNREMYDCTVQEEEDRYRAAYARSAEGSDLHSEMGAPCRCVYPDKCFCEKP